MFAYFTFNFNDTVQINTYYRNSYFENTFSKIACTVVIF